MAKKLPHKDFVIIGLGWTGSILAHELTDEGLEVIAIERGPWRDTSTDFPVNYAQDELRFRIRHELFLQPDQNTFTFRNKMDQTALPIRTWGAFMPPNGVGGGGVHWNAETWRFLPTDFVLKTHLTQRYGAKFLPEDMTIQDWGVTYEDLEPHYDAFERLCGTSGKAGNLQGKIQEGGNPFEGTRSKPYPNPPQKQGFGHMLWAKAAHELGYKPFPQPSGNMSQAYINPLGVRMGPCTYCGYCEWFGCGNYSKASPIETTPTPKSTPTWGAQWKKAIADYYLSNLKGRQHPRQLLQLPRHLSRPRPDVQRSLRQADAAHDDRLPRERAQVR